MLGPLGLDWLGSKLSYRNDTLIYAEFVQPLPGVELWADVLTVSRFN